MAGWPRALEQSIRRLALGAGAPFPFAIDGKPGDRKGTRKRLLGGLAFQVPLPPGSLSPSTF